MSHSRKPLVVYGNVLVARYTGMYSHTGGIKQNVARCHGARDTKGNVMLAAVQKCFTTKLALFGIWNSIIL
jgi:hypothetical protein